MPINQITDVSALSSLQCQDLETALLAVQMTRAELLETQLKGQIDAVQARNRNIEKLNNILSALNAVDAKFPADAKPDTKLNTIGDWTADSYAVAKQNEVAVNGALEDAGVENLFESNGSQGQISLDPPRRGAPNGLNSERSKSDITGAISKIKAMIDAQSNTQQMDMLRLQSLSGKRNEAYDIMTNFVKTSKDSRSSIAGNIR